jgi:hypothetical protein
LRGGSFDCAHAGLHKGRHVPGPPADVVTALPICADASVHAARSRASASAAGGCGVAGFGRLVHHLRLAAGGEM